MKRILVVDDSSSMRRIIARAAQLFGDLEVDEAQNSAQAIKMYEPGKYCLILTDRNMGGKTGVSLIKEIRQEEPDVPIIMITADSHRSQVVEAIEAGVSDYLSKPFTADMLQEKLEKWLG
ncbi:MAG: response regulator [Planctomycetia bacterium]|jgi:two-component system chemotaxis response regulator CheY